jgi:hypothetical protein
LLRYALGMHESGHPMIAEAIVRGADEIARLTSELAAERARREAGEKMIAAIVAMRASPAPAATGEGERDETPRCALCGSLSIAVDSVATGPRWDCFGCGAIVAMRARVHAENLVDHAVAAGLTCHVAPLHLPWRPARGRTRGP